MPEASASGDQKGNMAGLTKEQRAERAAAKASEASASGDHGVQFVLMHKDGDEIEVHPTCVAAHKQAGWKER